MQTLSEEGNRRGGYLQCLISASCIHLRLKASERLKGSKPALPGIDGSSKAAGCSMKGMAGETFMETACRETVAARQTRVPEREEEKPVTTGATKAVMLMS